MSIEISRRTFIASSALVVVAGAFALFMADECNSGAEMIGEFNTSNLLFEPEAYEVLPPLSQYDYDGLSNIAEMEFGRDGAVESLDLLPSDYQSAILIATGDPVVREILEKYNATMKFSLTAGGNNGELIKGSNNIHIDLEYRDTGRTRGSLHSTILHEAAHCMYENWKRNDDQDSGYACSSLSEQFQKFRDDISFIGEKNFFPQEIARGGGHPRNNVEEQIASLFDIVRFNPSGLAEAVVDLPPKQREPVQQFIKSFSGFVRDLEPSLYEKTNLPWLSEQM